MQNRSRPLTELVVIGEAFEDLIFSGLKRLPKLGEELRTDHFVRTIGGGVVITGVSAARLGLRVGVMSGLSDEATSLLHRESIAVTNLRQPHEAHATSIALSTVKDRSFVTFNGVNTVLEARLFEQLRELIAARHIHFALSPSHCRRWIASLKSLRSRGIKLSWDFGWNDQLASDRSFVSLLSLLDILFVNEQEAKLYSQTRTLERAVRFFRERVPLTIIKRGARGARWVSSDLDFTVAAPRVRVVDTTGAGDAFNGGFLYARIRGLPPRDCVHLGNRMGSLSTTDIGGINGLPPKGVSQ